MTKLGKDQADIVKATVEEKKGLVTETLILPGLAFIRSMDEQQLEQFFMLVVKSRINIREINLKLGDYQHNEIQVANAYASRLHEVDFATIAHLFTTLFTRDVDRDKVIGFRAVVDGASSALYKYVAIEEVKTPIYSDGQMIEEGDEKFKPTLLITYLHGV